jgi:hypothetical protein
MKLRDQFQNVLGSKQNKLDPIPGIMGDGTSLVKVPDVDNWVFCRINGEVTQVYNIRIAPVADLPVWVGYDADNPNVPQILGTRAGWTYGADQAQTVEHGEQHSWEGADPVPVWPQQIMAGRLAAYENLSVIVYPILVWASALGQYVLVEALDPPVDLSIYSPINLDKALYVLCTINASGVLVWTVGSEFDVVLSPNYAGIPRPPSDSQYVLGAVRLYFNQEAIIEALGGTDIVDLRFVMKEIIDDFINPMTTKGDMIYESDAAEIRVENYDPGINETINPSTANEEAAIPGCTLVISTGSPITITWDVWTSVSAYGYYKYVTINLRRGSVTGALLATSDQLMTADSTNGHNVQFSGSFVDNSPTDGVYVLTSQSRTAAAVVYSDTHDLTLTRLHLAPERLPIGTDEGDILTRIGGLPVWAAPAKPQVAIKSGNYTLAANDDVVVFTATANAFLPAATVVGQTYRIICRTGSLVIFADGSDTIKGESSQTLYAGEDLILTCTETGKWE